MKKLLFIGIILMSFLIACGSSKNEKQNENPDSEETNDSDIDTVETYDGDITPDNPDTTNDVDNSGNTQPDDDPEDPPYGGRGCNARTSYGSNSFTRDESSVFDDCAREAKYSDSSCCYPDAAELFLKLQKTTIIFEKDCKQNEEPVPCPDFIPESITLSQLTGCNIYRNESTPNDAQPCLSDCPEFYFSTDNETFKTVEFRHDYEYNSNYPFQNAFLESSNSERTIFLTIDTSKNTAFFKSSDSLVTLPFEILVNE